MAGEREGAPETTGSERGGRRQEWAPLRVRRDADIYDIDGGWFRARWHFSFDRYFDPSNMGIGQMRVLNHDTLRPGATWPMHPHRDVEGITYVVKGTFEHFDSLGNGGVLEEGGVQRMTLGAGAQHSESNHSKTAPMEFVQVWIWPATRGLPPSVEQRQFRKGDSRNRLLRAVKPEGAAGPGVSVHQDASLYVANLDPEAAVEHRFGAGRVGYVYLVHGAIDLNGEGMSTGDAVYVDGAGLIEVRATEDSELLVVETPTAA